MEDILGWILIGLFIAIILMAFVTIYTQKAFQKKNAIFAMKQSSKQLTGAEVAQKILEKNGINNVKIRLGKENQDHFNPREGYISLSPSVFNSSSVSAMAIAAHECGHAIQWKEEMKIIKLRDILVKPVNIATKVGNMMFSIGMMFMLMSMFTSTGSSNMMTISGIITIAGLTMYGAMGIFQLVTLPVEFNASKKAKKELAELKFMTTENDIKGTKSVLNAAAMTYVIAFLTTVTVLALFLIRLILMLKR